MSYYVSIKKSDIPIAKKIYESNNFSIEIFPYTKKGLTQSKWSKLRVTNNGNSFCQKMINCKGLKNSNIKKYVEEW